MKKLVFNPVYFLFVFSAFCTLLVSSCIKTTKPTDRVVIQQKTEPTSLFPLGMGVVSAEANLVNELVFQPLINLDFYSYELVPVLATARPKITQEAGGKVRFTFDIRDEAVWDNGTPITAEDVAFSLKLLRMPGMEGMPVRSFFDKLINVVLDKTKPKHLELVFSEANVFFEMDLTNLRILPHYVYDTKNLLAKYTYEDLLAKSETIQSDETLKAFGDELLNGKYNREVVEGSGPYTFKKWETMRNITLERKANWWGDKVTENKSTYFEANPKNIVLEIIKDEASAIAALQGKQIDFMPAVSPNAFFKTNFSAVADTFSKESLAQFYIGMNMQCPQLADVSVRRAMAHLVDKKAIVRTVMNNCAKQLTTMYSDESRLCNKSIKDYEFSIEKAKATLAAAGWRDTDSDSVLDKMINGKKIALQIDCMYGTATPISGKIAAIISETAKKASIKINEIPLDPSEATKRMKAGDSQIWIGGRSTFPMETSIALNWKSGESSNYAHLINSTVDSLINLNEKEPDAKKRLEILYAIQTKLHEQVPFIFMYNRKNLMVMNKTYTIGKPSMLSPGYWAGSISKK